MKTANKIALKNISFSIIALILIYGVFKLIEHTAGEAAAIGSFIVMFILVVLLVHGFIRIRK